MTHLHDLPGVDTLMQQYQAYVGGTTSPVPWQLEISADWEDFTFDLYPSSTSSEAPA